VCAHIGPARPRRQPHCSCVACNCKIRTICRAAAATAQELPKSESAAWAAVPGLQQLAGLAGSYLLVACAEAAAEGAAGAEGASKGLEGLGLAGAAAQQVRPV
jgi:hypothetical protein